MYEPYSKFLPAIFAFNVRLTQRQQKRLGANYRSIDTALKCDGPVVEECSVLKRLCELCPGCAWRNFD